MNRKKVAFLATASLVLGLVAAGCKGPNGGGGGGSGDADLTYWCPNVDNEIMETIVKNFKASKEEYADLEIKRLANWGEGETATQLTKDIKKAADVMLMADDNIRSSVDGEGLVAFSSDDVAKFTTEAGSEAVKACSIGDEFYGLPYRADNSPMPIYDTQLFAGDNAAKLGSLEGMLEVAKAAGKKVYLDVGNGWYNPFLLWTAGGDFGIHTKEDGSLTIATNFGNQNDTTKAKRAEIAKVLNATKALYNQYQDTWEIGSDNSAITAGFKDGEIAVAFLWNDFSNIKEQYENVSVTTWPTLTVDGEAKPLHCFQGYKAVVCKNGLDEERVELSKEFARYLAGADAQRLRAQQLKYGPANIAVAQEFDANALPFSTMISRMAQAGLCHAQATRVTDSFWPGMATLGALVTDKTSGWGTFGNADRALVNLLSTTGWDLTAMPNN